MATRKELVLQQIEIFNEIQNAGFNIVNCGNCGTLLLHRTVPIEKPNEEHEIECFGCRQVQDHSDCPDYWYEGAELSEVFEETKPFCEWLKTEK